ncbi:SAF domain-containing protein [Actinomadura sp. LOL_016]|uniref:SAF domain-containing protein n=1 Tax=unclassified Actinomadura TaxID=2626254 RepID=UPI003A7FF0E2
MTRLRRPLATLFAAAAAWLVLLTLRPGPPPAVRVLAAARDLPAGATLAPSDVRPVSLPPEAVPSGALRADAAGRVLAGPMRRGEPLTDVRVIGDRLLRGYGPDKVATPIRIADADTVRLVRPGDRIDVLAAPPATSHGEAPMTTPLSDTRPSRFRGEHEPLRRANSDHGTSRSSPSSPGTSGALPRRRTTGAHDPPVLEPVSHSRPVAPADPEPGERLATPPPRSTSVHARPSTTLATAGVGGRAAARAGRAPWDGARVVVSSVPVIAVPSSEKERTGDGALLVLATSRTQALALAGSRTDLSVTITAS